MAFDVVLQDTSSEADSVLGALTGPILALQEAELFSWSLYIIFLLTTLAGLYPWIFQMFTFHKRMSIVPDTLSRASTHLTQFLFVFFLERLTQLPDKRCLGVLVLVVVLTTPMVVVLAFAALTFLLVGSSTKEISTLEDAWRSVIRISPGESDNLYPQILDA
ncbi:unnamed protein product [Ectocarpus sp. CCAP 1310/34]|nr:unnamed protein product [Ectocarpus sp. CCAP 1310/34]